MKKIIAGVLSFVMIVSFAGCTKDTDVSSETESPVTIESSDDILSALSDKEGIYKDVFTEDEISTVNVKISEDDWQDILDNAKDEVYHTADITVNGTTVSNVGFRTKGNSTLTSVADSDSDRYGFKIKFDEYVDSQTLNGLDMMVLNANFADPSYMREYLAYAASESIGAITPFASYSKLYINDEYYGLYLSIESYKDSFVERYTSDDKAVLYKADKDNCTLLSNDDGSGFDIEYGKKNESGQINNLISILNDTTSENYKDLESILDVDSVLKAMAVNVVTGNYDSYSGSKAHNYYLLYSDGTFKYIGWDYNMAFGGFVEDGGSSITVEVSDPFFSVDSSQRPLMSKLLEIDEYNQKYLSYVEELKTFFSDYENKINTIADFIREDVKTDPTAFYTIDDFEKNISDTGTDLSQITAKGGKNGQMPMMPFMNGENGEMPERPEMTQSGDSITASDNQSKTDLTDDMFSTDNQNFPPMPDGMTPPEDGQGRPPMPYGMTPPEGFDNSDSGYGMTPPDDENRPEMPDGMTPPDDQSNPELADGATSSNNQSKPQSADGATNNQGRPEMADGSAPSDNQSDQGLANGMTPPDNNMGGRPNGGGMVNTDTVSIYDYIKQKLERI